VHGASSGRDNQSRQKPGKKPKTTRDDTLP
jgi:hypothetical protein